MCKKKEHGITAFCYSMLLFYASVIAGGNQLRLFQGKIERRDNENLQNDTREAGYKVAGSPGLPGIGARRKNERSCHTGDDTSRKHGGNQADVDINHVLASADKVHHQAGYKTVYGKLHHHGRQIADAGHASDQAGEQGAGDTAEKAVGPATYQTADQHGKVHGGKQRSAVGNGVKSEGQYHTEGNADCGGDTSCQVIHLFHLDSSFYNKISGGS